MTTLKFFNKEIEGEGTQEELIQQAAYSFVAQFLPIGETPTQEQVDNAIALWDLDGDEQSGKDDFLQQAQAEIDWLEINIPLIDSITTITQVRTVLKRLAQENRAIIKALVFVGKRVANN